MVKTILLVCILLSLTSCGDQRILERLGLIQAVGYDLMPEGKLMVTISFPSTDPRIKRAYEVISTIADSPKEARINLSAQTSHKLVTGQMRSVSIGNSLAKTGIWKDIDTLIRDPSISRRVDIVIVNGNSKDILQSRYSQHPETSQYISRLIEKEMRENAIPQSTLLTFSRDYHDGGIDPVAPIIKNNKEHIIIDGIALFNDDKYVMKIERENINIFVSLHNNYRQGNASLDLIHEAKKKERVTLSNLINKRTLKVDAKDVRHIKVNIDLDVRGSIMEYIGDLKLSDPADERKLETQIAQYYTEKADQMIKEMQRNHVDSLGIGKNVRNKLQYSQWEKLNWREVYPTIEVTCTAKVRIKDIGRLNY